jgi:hypothetical protein
MESRGLDSLAPYLTSWINAAVYEIANEFPLPALRLKEPVSLTVTESDWLYDLPATYMKKLFKCYDSDWNKITVSHSLDNIDSQDIDHDETGNHVTHVAVRDTQIGIYPKAAESIKLWYYKKPTNLIEPTDELICIPSQWHATVVIPKIVLKNIHLFEDMAEDVIWWTLKYETGLFGGNGNIGMINCLARDKKVRKHGGRNPLP